MAPESGFTGGRDCEIRRGATKIRWKERTALRTWKDEAESGAVAAPLTTMPAARGGRAGDAPGTLGTVEKSVLATGLPKPTDLVAVGAQVSGRISRLAVVLGKVPLIGRMPARIVGVVNPREEFGGDQRLNVHLLCATARPRLLGATILRGAADRGQRRHGSHRAR